MTTSSSSGAVASESKEAKVALRRRMIALREAITPEERAAISLAGQNHILALPAWRRARQVLLYSPVRGELDTALLMCTAIAQGKQVLLPRCLSSAESGQGCMELAFCGGEEELCPGPFDILQPDPALCPAASAEDLRPDLAIIPGTAFTLCGQRMGYGGGYYDRFFANNPLPDCLRIGFCAQIQVLASLPQNPWDTTVHAVCTESGFYPVRGCL